MSKVHQTGETPDGTTVSRGGAQPRTRLDRYLTPPALVDAVMDAVQVRGGILEPSAGTGAWIAGALQRYGAQISHVTAVDLELTPELHLLPVLEQAEAVPAKPASGRSWRLHQGDFLDTGAGMPWSGRYRRDVPAPSQSQSLFPSDWPATRWYNFAVGNPPFTAAEAHTRKALELSHEVVFLLRTGFLASAERVPFWRQYGPHLRTVYFLAQRPREWGASYDYAVYHFDQRSKYDGFTGKILNWR